jgi:hypothetical protein
MKNIIKAIVLLVLVTTLVSCNSFAPQPTETPTSTATSLPTFTNTPDPTDTPTIVPTQTPVPATETPSQPVLPMPSGKPVSKWGSIPVMPKAIAGDGNSSGYSFTINASVDEIQKFYEKELSKLGWNLFASGAGNTDAVILIFMKDGGTLSVSIIPQQDGTTYVMLVK